MSTIYSPGTGKPAYKVGDLVVLKPLAELLGKTGMVPEMHRYCGKAVTVAEISSAGLSFRIEETRPQAYYFSSEWIDFGMSLFDSEDAVVGDVWTEEFVKQFHIDQLRRKVAAAGKPEESFTITTRSDGEWSSGGAGEVGC